MKKRIALIYGGEGCEREISTLGAKNLFSMIDKERYVLTPVFISSDGSWFIRENFSEKDSRPTFPVYMDKRSGLLLDGDILDVSAAIPALHGDFGEDGRIQGALDTAHIPYIGCGVSAGALAADKIYTKIIAEHLGIPTARWIVFQSGDDPYTTAAKAEEIFGYPSFIKPPTLGSSIGAHKASTRTEFLKALEDARALGDGRVLIEEYIDSECEIECALLNFGTKQIFSGGKILTDGKFYDYDGKYGETSNIKTEHGNFRDTELSRLSKIYAEKISRFLSLRHVSRIDFLLSRCGRLYFNEINTFPGMTNASLYPSMTEDMGYRRGEFINLLLSEVAR